jgi:hypothetical protein
MSAALRDTLTLKKEEEGALRARSWLCVAAAAPRAHALC